MICKKCGVDITGYEDKCPYCGEEFETEEKVSENNDTILVPDDDFSFVKSMAKISFFAVPTVLIMWIIIFIMGLFLANDKSIEQTTALGGVGAICSFLIGILVIWQGTIGLITSIVSLFKTAKYKDLIDEDHASGEVLNKRKKNVLKGFIYGIIGLVAGVIALIMVINGVKAANETLQFINSIKK